MRGWYEKSADAPCPSLLELTNHFLHFDCADATSWAWIRWQEKSIAQVWQTKRDESMLTYFLWRLAHVQWTRAVRE